MPVPPTVSVPLPRALPIELVKPPLVAKVPAVRLSWSALSAKVRLCALALRRHMIAFAR